MLQWIFRKLVNLGMAFASIPGVRVHKCELGNTPRKLIHTCLECHGARVTSRNEDAERFDMDGEGVVGDDLGENVRCSLSMFFVYDKDEPYIEQLLPTSASESMILPKYKSILRNRSWLAIRERACGNRSRVLRSRRGRNLAISRQTSVEKLGGWPRWWAACKTLVRRRVPRGGHRCPPCRAVLNDP